MGNEVSCRALDIWFRAAPARGLAVEALIADVGYPLKHLQDKRARIDWAAFACFLRNVGKYWTSAELVESGRQVIRNPYTRYFSVIARTLLDARGFYEFVFRKGSGAGNQTFSNVEPDLVVVAPNVVRLRMTIPPQFVRSDEFFHICRGNFSEMPTILGLPPATVEMQSDGHVGTYLVTLPSGGGWLRRFWQALSSPFRAREVAAELRDAHDEVRLRFEQLQIASGLVERKKQELEVISVITAAAHASHGLPAALNAICVQVNEQLGYEYTRFEVHASQDGADIIDFAESGSRRELPEKISAPLTFRNVSLGELSAAREKVITDDERRFFHEVAASCALAVNNAVGYEAIQLYRKDLEDRVAERTAQLSSALEQVKFQQAARQKIFQNISHELRTPLSLIGLSSQDVMYRDGDALSPKSKERLDQIDDSIARLLHLFDGMLLLAAGQENKLRIRPVQTDLAITLRSLVSAWQLAAEKQGIALHYGGPERLTVRVDEPGVERLVSNLLSNAIKFTPQGGTIELRLEELSGQQIQIAVQDSGVGMDTEFLGRVFGRFEQGPAPVRTGERGSGIGLAIVKEIAEAHSGTARVESQRGMGSTFFVTLPKDQDLAKLAEKGEGSYIAAVQRAPERDTQNIKLTADVSPQHKTAMYTVLVAEDDPALRQFLVELLSREYRVVAAADGLAALRLAKEHHPALLVSDIGMPGIDGIELTKRFRATSGDKLAPVILLTAYAMVESRLAGFDAGAIDYVTKPFNPDELLSRIKGQLQLRAMAMRLHESQKLAGLGVLSAGLAHELRNPANGVVNAIGPLKKMLPKEVLAAGTPTALLIEAMSSGAEQIAVLTKQLLGFSRQGEIDVRDEGVTRIFDSAAALVEPVLAGRVLKRDMQYGDKVRCARGLVVQVLVNLLENAAHASPPNGEIFLTSRLEGDRVFFEVRDTGKGVPKEARERIFDPFFTTKPPGQGTGLGLTISKMIAERHGGDLRLLENEPCGAFRLELPVGKVDLPKTSPVLDRITATAAGDLT